MFQWTSVDYIIEKIGGYTDNVNEMFVLGGGPMMGKSIANDTFVVTTYSNSITVPKVVEGTSLSKMWTLYWALSCKNTACTDYEHEKQREKYRRCNRSPCWQMYYMWTVYIYLPI